MVCYISSSVPVIHSVKFITSSLDFGSWQCDTQCLEKHINSLVLRLISPQSCRIAVTWEYGSTYIHTYIHKLTPFSHEGRQKLQNASCYDPYILLSPHPRSYIWSYKHAGYEYYALDLSEEFYQ